MFCFISDGSSHPQILLIWFLEVDNWEKYSKLFASKLSMQMLSTTILLFQL